MKLQQNQRFARVVKRLLYEIAWIRIEGVALRELGKGIPSALKFFYVAHTGLRGDRLARLIRVFDEGKDVASFWYLHRCKPKEMGCLFKRSGVMLEDLKSVSRKLKLIRNRTFVHIDKLGVQDPAQVYKDADLRGREIQRAITAIWRVLRGLERAMGQTPEKISAYSGKDIRAMFRAKEAEMMRPNH